jgi:hypothetical protein
MAKRKYPTWSGLAWMATARVMVSSSGLIAPVGAGSGGGTVDCGLWDCWPPIVSDIIIIKDVVATTKRMQRVTRLPLAGDDEPRC